MADAPPNPPRNGADGKLQQLLGLAKERLQAQQAALTGRDATIQQLREDLDKEKKREKTFGVTAQGEPSQALCVVNSRDISDREGRWALFEFESDDGVLPPEWRHFESKAALDDFVRRDPGREPITLPEAALTPRKSEKLRRNASEEVTKAQASLREAKSRFAVDKARLDGLLRDATRSNVRDDDIELKKRRDALLAATAPNDALSAQEVVLRKRVEELTQENARLQQPRRYDAASASDGPDLATKYDALRREYKLYRANALKALQEQKALAADAAKGLQLADLGRRSKPAGSVGENNRVAYLKNLMAQYLACAEEAPRAHMERAVMTVLGFTAQESERVAKKRAEKEYEQSSALTAWFSQTPAPMASVTSVVKL